MVLSQKTNVGIQVRAGSAPPWGAFLLFAVLRTAVALKMLTAIAFKMAQNLTALKPLTLRCLTRVRLSYSDIVPSTPARHL